MTSRPRPCIVCGGIGPWAGARCPRHTRSNWAQRGSASDRGYGWGWTKIRNAVLAAEPNCRRCGAKATFVDHIRNKAEGGTNDRSNLQPLCALCHSHKTQAEAVRGQRRKNLG